MDISILTNDFALFSDTDIERHRRGMDCFRDQIASYFEKGIIRSVAIIIVDTDTFALWETPTSNLAQKEIQNSTPFESHHTEEETMESLVDTDENALTKENMFLSNLFHPHKLKVKDCLRSIQDRLSLFRDIESKHDEGNRKSNPVHVRLHVMECNSISFQSLLVDWTKDAVKSIGTHQGATGGMARISFDLPSTSDGTQCSISLDLNYATFPHRLDLPNGLWDDMKMLHESMLRIIHMAPLKDIDSALIYGVPMIAKAGSVGDLMQYKEMKGLVQQLWKYLITHQVALVLQIKHGHTKQIAEHDKETGACGALYHSDRQLFLLVVEENTETASLSPHGILYRYADRSDQILHHGCNEPCESMNDAMPDSTEELYYDFIVQSLDNLQTSSINPFCQHHVSSHDQLSDRHQSSEDKLLVPSPGHETGSSPPPSQSPIRFEIVNDDWDDQSVQCNDGKSSPDLALNHENDQQNLSDPDLFEY